MDSVLKTISEKDKSFEKKAKNIQTVAKNTCFSLEKLKFLHYGSDGAVNTDYIKCIDNLIELMNRLNEYVNDVVRQQLELSL